jgi:hypothetical protein
MLQAAMKNANSTCDEADAVFLDQGYDLKQANQLAQQLSIDPNVSDSIVQGVTRMIERCPSLSPLITTIYDAVQVCAHCKQPVLYRQEPCAILKRKDLFMHLTTKSKVNMLEVSIDKLMGGKEVTVNETPEHVSCATCDKATSKGVLLRTTLRKPAEILFIDVERYMAKTTDHRVKEFAVGNCNESQQVNWTGDDGVKYTCSYALAAVALWHGNVADSTAVGHYTYLPKSTIKDESAQSAMKNAQAKAQWYWMNPMPGQEMSECRQVREHRMNQFETTNTEQRGLVCMLVYVRTTPDPMGGENRKSRLSASSSGDPHGPLRQGQGVNYRQDDDESNAKLDAEHSRKIPVSASELDR